jgi:hypothetical protein
MKRINNEILNFNIEKYNIKYTHYKSYIERFFTSITPYLLIDNDTTKDTCILQILFDNVIIIELTIDECYPFRPFIISKFNFEKNYKNLPYNKFLASLNTTIAKQHIDVSILRTFFKIQYLRDSVFLNLINNKCFCCNSKTCYMLWSPSLTFKDILIEYLEVCFIEKYCDLRKYKEIYHIYTKLFYKLPQEIINKILLLI